MTAIIPGKGPPVSKILEDVVAELLELALIKEGEVRATHAQYFEVPSTVDMPRVVVWDDKFGVFVGLVEDKGETRWRHVCTVVPIGPNADFQAKMKEAAPRLHTMRVNPITKGRGSGPVIIKSANPRPRPTVVVTVHREPEEAAPSLEDFNLASEIDIDEELAPEPPAPKPPRVQRRRQEPKVALASPLPLAPEPVQKMPEALNQILDKALLATFPWAVEGCQSTVLATAPALVCCEQIIADPHDRDDATRAVIAVTCNGAAHGAFNEYLVAIVPPELLTAFELFLGLEAYAREFNEKHTLVDPEALPHRPLRESSQDEIMDLVWQVRGKDSWIYQQLRKQLPGSTSEIEELKKRNPPGAIDAFEEFLLRLKEKSWEKR